MLVLNAALSAQQNVPPLPRPSLLTVFPCGAQAGTTVEVSCAGAELGGATELLFSTPGITAELVSAPKPRVGNAPPPPIKIRVTVPASASLGIHDVRIVTPLGVSNPRAFVIGDKPEIVEREQNDDVPQAQRIELNSVVHGVIGTPTDVDYFVFKGKQGQELLAYCQSATIDSRLDAAIELYDAAGKKHAFNRHYFESDALIDFTPPADGDYYLRLFGYAHTQGDAQHFYRLSLVSFPPTRPSFLPIGVSSGFVSPRLAMDRGDRRQRADEGTGASVEQRILEIEPNDSQQHAQAVSLPFRVLGRIDHHDDRDWYSFPMKKGETTTLELSGDRTGSPNDFYMSVRDANGKELRELDDPPPSDILHPSIFYNRTFDPPAYKFTAPADGTYYVMVSAHDAATVFGPRSAYRLRIGPARPDFHIIVMPNLDNTPQTQIGPRAEAPIIPRGGREYLDVFIARHDGFNGEVTLLAEGLPPGVTCAPQVVPANAKQGALVFESTDKAQSWAGAIKVFGTATIDQKVIRREARSATVTWPINQRNVPTITRLDRQLVVAVRDPGPYRISVKVDKLELRPGDRVTIPFEIERIWPDFKSAVNVHLLNLPVNVISLNNATIAEGETKVEATLTVRGSTPPGNYQLVFVGKSQPFQHGVDVRGRPANYAVRMPCNPVILTVLPEKD